MDVSPFKPGDRVKLTDAGKAIWKANHLARWNNPDGLATVMDFELHKMPGETWFPIRFDGFDYGIRDPKNCHSGEPEFFELAYSEPTADEIAEVFGLNKEG